MTLPGALLAAAALFGLGLLVWWLIFETEGVYLGRRVVIWLYDLYAGRYDSIKAVDESDEHLLLAAPIMERLAPHTDPFVLDVATGTGRLPLALAGHARFEGHVIGLDLSRRMLYRAALKMQQEHFEDFITLLRAPAENLPFPDNSFDLVTCLEALEFIPRQQTALAEMARVLRPGGLLLLTNRINTRWMPGQTRTRDQLAKALEAAGLRDVVFEHWQMDYQKVWASKGGTSSFIGARPLEEVLCCPVCRACGWLPDTEQWRCTSCGHTLFVTPAGALEVLP